MTQWVNNLDHVIVAARMGDDTNIFDITNPFGKTFIMSKSKYQLPLSEETFRHLWPADSARYCSQLWYVLHRDTK